MKPFLALFLSLAILPGTLPDDQSPAPLDASGATGGFIVGLGCGDPKETASLRANDGCLVFALDTDPARITALREEAPDIQADLFDGARLPLIDNLVTLLVAAETFRVPRDEMLRVLAPGGILLTKTETGWEKTEKEKPDDIDEWTHYLHNPGNNAVAKDTRIGPPRRIQWLGAPLWSRNHHKLNSISSVVTADRRLFFIVDEATSANINVPGKWSIVACDAFNGVRLWTRPMTGWASNRIGFRSGPPQVARLLVAADNRIFAPLGLNAPVSRLDAATGKTLQTYPETEGAEEIILTDDRLLVLCGAPVAAQTFRDEAFSESFRFPNQKKLVSLDPKGGKIQWVRDDFDGLVRAETLAGDAGRVFLQVDEAVLCLDGKTGTSLWKTAGQKGPSSAKKNRGITYGKFTLVVVDGVVLCRLNDNLCAFSAEEGKPLWNCRAGTGFHSPLDVFVIDGVVWRGDHVRDSIAPPPINDFSEGRDLHTGEIVARNQVAVDLQTAGHHHRCYREKATSRYILTGKRGIEMMDMKGENHSRNNWVRGTCQYGILPANGLIYVPPNACGCYMESLIKGFWALAPEGPAPSRIPDDRRLEKGSAFGKKIDGGTGASDAWLQYRGNALRSGATSAKVPEEPVEVWETAIGERLTPPVVADGKVIVASVDAGIIHVLDDRDGTPIWQYKAGGPIDSPPAIHGGLVIFGSADGKVTCLSLADGGMIWRFTAAPSDRRTVVFGKVESVWPVHGSVLILNDVAYCSAGRSTWIDGGIELWGLDPATGKILHHSRQVSRHPAIGEGKTEETPEHRKKKGQNLADYRTALQPDLSDSFSMAGGIVSDVLVSDGRDVYLHHARFDAALKRKEEMGRHLFSTSSLLDDAENHRSHLFLGTGDFSMVAVAYSWIANRMWRKESALAVPAGVTLVFDDESVWVVRRKGDANGGYFLMRRPNRPFSETEEAPGDFRDLSKEDATRMDWKVDLSMRTRAMIRAGECIVLGAAPVAIPENDPHAAYEGRTGGAILFHSPKDGSPIGRVEIDSPPVWEGMAVTKGGIFVSATDGAVRCYGKK